MIELFSNWVKQRRRQDRPRSSNLKINFEGRLICKGCEDLERRCVARMEYFENYGNRDERRWVTIHPNYAELESYAEIGCATCRVWRKLLLQQCSSHDLALSLAQSPHRIEADISELPEMLISAKPPNGKYLSAQLKLGSTGEYGYGLTDITWQSLNPDPISDEVISLIREWFHDDCLEKHWKCRGAMGNGSPPRRLLAISDDGLTVRLVDGEKLPHPEPYIALSYRWGTSQNLKTTKDNEAAHRNGIPARDLPKTIRDAVTICCLLRVSYLWVDALCIIQDAGVDEWSTEAANMHNVYGHAAMTLAICSSADAGAGFLQLRLAEAYELMQDDFKFANMYIRASYVDLHYVRTRYSLASRGWAFQEERLSPRILYWSDNGVFWSCQSSEHSETGKSAKADDWGETPLPSQAKRFALGSWHDMIQEYATREFTRPNDRLGALSGLASRYKNANSSASEYIAGHWLYHLPVDLLWRPDRLIAPPTAESEYIGPSWSWVSIPSAAKLKIYNESYMPLSKVIDYSAPTLGPDPFGALKPHAASLTVQGRFRLLLRDNPEEIMWQDAHRSEDGRLVYPSLRASSNVYAFDPVQAGVVFLAKDCRPAIVYLDWERASGLDVLFCLEITWQGFLIVEELPEKPGEYRRVGCTRMHEDHEFFEGSPVTDVKLV
ncbi:heterokaryon incompatibility protein-domain-containing protein [Hypomontagnella monticulosa]|nr:heterokaryon incompatibility protein-domain-containing protein [Hypomontagnella monticulosa]